MKSVISFLTLAAAAGFPLYRAADDLDDIRGGIGNVLDLAGGNVRGMALAGAAGALVQAPA